VEAEIDVNPGDGTGFDFTATVVGMQSSPELISVSNLGSGSLKLTCNLAGDDPASFSVSCPSLIGAGNDLDVSVSCSPAATGNLSAQLQIFSNDVDEPQLDYDLTCIGVTPEFDPDPPASSLLDFGTVFTTENSEIVELMIENTGTSELALGCGLQGAAADSYQIVQCPASVAVGETVTVQLQCSPMTEGTKQAQLLLTTDDLDEPEAIYDLSCEALLWTDTIHQDGFEDSP
jgi:hypothetical protein